MKPDSLAYFEAFSERSLVDLDDCKEQGIKIAGFYCIFVPTEIIRAAGAVPVALCGKKQEPISKAEEILPANLCPLIKSSYGYALTDTCPFFAASDFIIGETTCDGKKKMFELLGNLKPLHLMHLPYTQDQPMRSPSGMRKFSGSSPFSRNRRECRFDRRSEVQDQGAERDPPTISRNNRYL